VRVCLLGELLEGSECARPVHGARSAVHRDGDAERFGNLDSVAEAARIFS
jgi:hypothetical protein